MKEYWIYSKHSVFIEMMMWFLSFISMLYIFFKLLDLDKCKTKLFSISLEISLQEK